jgi:hypothetical protein
MRYLFNRFPISSGTNPQPFDANTRTKGPFIDITESAKRIRRFTDRRNICRQIIGRGENFSTTTYLPQHMEALSG